MNPTNIKTWLEIIALTFAAVFLILKLGSGQFNSGMKVSMIVTRDPDDSERAFVKLKLERPDSGRIILSDVVFQVYGLDPNDDKSKKSIEFQRGDVGRIRERIINGSSLFENGAFTALPPEDSTEFEYEIRIPKSRAVLIDCTIFGKRRFFQYIPMPGIGEAQWRMS